jgi:hypothetical protein
VCQATSTWIVPSESWISEPWWAIAPGSVASIADASLGCDGDWLARTHPGTDGCPLVCFSFLELEQSRRPLSVLIHLICLKIQSLYFGTMLCPKLCPDHAESWAALALSTPLLTNDRTKMTHGARCSHCRGSRSEHSIPALAHAASPLVGCTERSPGDKICGQCIQYDFPRSL